MPLPIPAKNDSRYLDYVITMGAENRIRDGIVNEPRIYFAEIPVPAVTNLLVQGAPEVFYNGEQFPVRITHMLACTRYLNDATPQAPDNPLNIQRIACKLRFNDQFYMNASVLPLPIWGNKVVAAPEAFSASNAHWDLVQTAMPFVLAVRDSLLIEVQLQDLAEPTTPVPVTFAFHGVGALSHRPYILTGSALLDSITPTSISSVDFRNDGSEPIVITDITATVGAETGDNSPLGDINRVRFKIRQSGAGTGSDWIVGPNGGGGGPVTPMIQNTLLGLTSGRAVVHQFPGEGLIWQPGMGITADVAALVDDMDSVLVLAFAGYIMVT